MPFYNFVNKADEPAELFITGDIVDDDTAAWYSGNDVECASHKAFKASLDKCKGKDITVYINSYGGDTAIASEIYTDLLEYKGNITVKIPSIAASAASIIAMAGDKVLMSPTAMMMIHNPWTVAIGDKHELKATIHVLETVGETIINAYERKTHLSREEIQKLMDKDNQGSWFDCNEAKQYGFIDGIIGEETDFANEAILNAIKGEQMRIYNKVAFKPPKAQEQRIEEPKPEVEQIAEEAEEEPTEDEIRARVARILNIPPEQVNQAMIDCCCPLFVDRGEEKAQKELEVQAEIEKFKFLSLA